MNKEKMCELIDSENGEGFSKNIDLSGYNFYKRNSFISFKIKKVEDINVVIIKYIYSEKYSELISLLSYSSNFWLGKNVKLIYYKEREKHPYVIEKLEELGFDIRKIELEKEYKHNFKAKKLKNQDKEHIIEAFV